MWDEIYENCIETDKKLKEIFQMTPFQSQEKENSDDESQDSEKKLEIDLDKVDAEEAGEVTEEERQPTQQQLLPPPQEKQVNGDVVVAPKVVVEATDSNQNTLKCIYCETVAPKSQQDLNEHYRNHHFDSVFHCEMCDNFLDRNDLMPHMVQHALEAACSSNQTAANGSSTPDTVQNGAGSSSATEPKSAPATPDQPTPNSSKAPSGGGKTPGKENQLYYCTVCQKHFSSHSGYTYHINQIHSKIKNYSCNFCGKKFGMKRILDNHIRNIHSNEKNFQCLQCLKYFKTDAALYNHQLIHKQSSFACEFCDKKFHYKHNLEVHRLLHSEERKYSCNHCASTFKTRNYLSKHLKSHFNGAKSFFCTQCDFRTTQKRYLAEHIKRKHSKTSCTNSP